MGRTYCTYSCWATLALITIATQQFLDFNMATHWSKTFWLSYSADLNTPDDVLWGMLQAKVNHRPNKDNLRRTIQQATYVMR